MRCAETTRDRPGKDGIGRGAASLKTRRVRPQSMASMQVRDSRASRRMRVQVSPPELVFLEVMNGCEDRRATLVFIALGSRPDREGAVRRDRA